MSINSNTTSAIDEWKARLRYIDAARTDRRVYIVYLKYQLFIGNNTKWCININYTVLLSVHL